MEEASVNRLAKEASDRLAAACSGRSAHLMNLTGHVALAFVALIGGATIIGWKLEMPALVRAGPDIVAMQFKTALCFLLSAMSILLVRRGYKRAAIGGAGMVFGIAAVSGVQYLGEWDFGVDRLLDDPFITDKMSHPGRMAPNTSLMFMVLSLAMISRGLNARGRARREIPTVLCGVVLGYCIIVLLAYLAGVEASYRWSAWTAMAVQAGVCFALLACVILLFSWEEDQASDDLRIFPDWVSRAVFIAVCAGSIGAWHGLTASADKSIRSEARTALGSLEQLLTLTVTDKVKAFIRLADRLHLHDMSIDPAFSRDVDNYLDGQPDLAFVAVLDGGGRMLWKASRDDTQGWIAEKLIDSTLSSLVFELQSQEEEKGVSKRLLQLPLILNDGRHLAILYRPDSESAEAERVLAFVYDADVFIEIVTTSVRNSGFAYQIKIGNLVLSGLQTDAVRLQNVRPLSSRLNLHGTDFFIQVWPSPAKWAAVHGLMPEIVLMLGIASAALSGGALSMLRSSRRQEKLAVRANALLVEEVAFRRESEADLGRLKKRFELILDSAGEGIYGLDQNGYSTFTNSAAVRMTGWSREEMAQRPQHEVIHHSHEDGRQYPREGCPIYATLTDAKVHMAEEEVFWRKDGTCFPVEYTAAPIVDDQGIVEGAVVVFRDITDRREKEEALDRAYQELSATNRELEAFCYSVSHDLRAPLRAIGGFSEVLAEDFGDRLDDEGRGYLERIRVAANRMSGLIDDLLKLSRLTRQEIEEQTVDLSRIAQEVIEELRDGDPHHKVQVNILEGCQVTADPKLMRAVLQNLIGNAWKFTRRTVNPEIAFGSEAASDTGRQVCYVRDNGAGFDMAYAEKLFTPFQRLHKTGEFEGTGVGLAIVQRAIHRQNGKVWAESEPGKGATFYIEI